MATLACSLLAVVGWMALGGHGAERGLDLLAGCSPSGVWAHRGAWSQPSEQNTLAAFERARDRGFCGIELDVHFVEGPAGGRLVVGHEPPAAGGDAGLGFREVLRSLGGAPLHWWLDLKNLDRSRAEAVGQLLADLARSRAEGAWLAVESPDLPALATVRRLSGARILYAPRGGDTAGRLRALWNLWVHEPDAISLSEAEPEWKRWLFRRYPLAVWTVNDPARIRSFLERGAVVVLTDRATPPGLAPGAVASPPPAVEADRVH